jgi:hypothetical protein
MEERSVLLVVDAQNMVKLYQFKGNKIITLSNKSVPNLLSDELYCVGENGVVFADNADPETGKIDLLFSNIDRHSTNFGFYLDSNNNAELVLFDNGCFLSHYDIATRPLAFQVGGMSSMQFMSISKKEEAKEFFKRMSPEMRELVPMYLELFEPSRVEFMISQIEKEIGMEFPEKKYNMRKYKRNYSMVKRLLKGKKKEFSKSLVM